jgi:hypothetical protein
MAKRQRDIRREQRPRLAPMHPPECCEFRILVIGCTETALVSVGEESIADENLSVNTTGLAISRVDLHVKGDAIAHVDSAAFGAPAPAAGSNADSAADDQADGDGNAGSDAKADSRLQTTLRKARDKVVKSDVYCLHWKAIGARGPVVVRVEMTGEARLMLPCAFADGSAKASTVKLLDTAAPRVRGVTRVRVEAMDSCGQRDACVFELQEP